MQLKRTPVRKHCDDDAPKEFGEQVTADHIIAQDIVDNSILGDKTALIVMDRATQWIDVFPLLSKSALDTAVALKDFVGSMGQIDSFYSDNSPELKQVAHVNGWKHSTSTPGRPETNGVAERAVRTVIEGTRTALEQAGMTPRWWRFACKHFCFAKYISVWNGTSAWQSRHKGTALSGPLLPFGSLVNFKPTPVGGNLALSTLPRRSRGSSWATTSCQEEDGEATTGWLR